MIKFITSKPGWFSRLMPSGLCGIATSKLADPIKIFAFTKGLIR